MAYCVHCGVRLEEGARRCPLCQTPVHDPSAGPQEKPAERAYPVHTPEQALKKNKLYLLNWAVLLLLLPALLCLVLDCLTGVGISWGMSAAGALILLFISVAVPLLVSRHRVYWSLLASFLSLNGYLFLAERVSASGGWFFPIVLPSITLGTVMLLAVIVLYRRDHLNKLTLLAALLAAVAAQCLGIEGLQALAKGSGVHLVWSPYVLAPCVFISLVRLFIDANRAVREEVRRRVHF